MKLIRVEETGKQYQFNLPDLKSEQHTEAETSSKQARINMMLEKQGKNLNKVDSELNNYIELNFVYATISGFEYIKMNKTEFWHMINSMNALASIDSDELGFFGVNFFVPKKKESSNSFALDLVQFEYNFNGNVYDGNVVGMCDALANLDYNANNHSLFFEHLRYLG